MRIYAASGNLDILEYGATPTGKPDLADAPVFCSVLVEMVFHIDCQRITVSALFRAGADDGGFRIVSALLRCFRYEPSFGLPELDSDA